MTELCIHLLPSPSRLKADQNAAIRAAAFAGRSRPERCEQIGMTGSLRVRPQNPDHCVRFTFELDRFANELWVGMERKRPQSVTEYNYRRPMRTVFFLAETAAPVQRNA